MTQDEIIRMAREAGLPTLTEYGYESLKRFAALVATHERELCAKVVDHILKEGGGTYGNAIRARSEK